MIFPEFPAHLGVRAITSSIHTPTNLALRSSGIYVRADASDWQYHWPMHTHEGVEVYFFIQGQANYVVGDDIYDLLPGDMLLFRGSIMHRVNPSRGTPYLRSYVNFMPSFIQDQAPKELTGKLLALFDSPSGLLIRWLPDEREEIKNCFRMMQQEKEKEPFGHEYMLKTHLLQLLIRIYRKSKRLPDLSPLQQPSQTQATVRRILQYLNQHFTDNLNLDRIAKALHLNKYYMCHCFKEVTGYTINNYLMSKRIEEAKKLLLTSDHPIGAISEMLGFNTSVHFSRTFKQFAGASPQAFRKVSADR
ncbi:helix-turn-helix transcriptional regulator [Cohnella laeviribosi]|nr:AraC family transcriptional regulator [Cohnella sp.]REK62513.1 MAG: AraC family transcriptional regulator [Cohnella sp.]